MLKKWVVRIAIGVGVLLALIAVLGLAFWTASGFGPAAAMAKQQYADWQTNGLPVTKDQVVLTPSLSEEDNAVTEMREAIRLLKAVPKNPNEPTNLSDPDNFQNGKLRIYVEARRAAMEMAHRAALKPAIRFERDWDQGAYLAFPEFADFKAIAKCLAMDAEFRARDGDWQGAVRDIRTARRLAAFSAADATLISKLVGIAIDAIILDTAGICASRFADNPAAISALRKALEDTKWDIDRDSAVRGEAYMSVAYYRSTSDRDIIAMLDGRYEDELEADYFAGYKRPAPAIVRDGLPASTLARAVNAEVMAFWNEFYPRLKNPNEDLKRLAADMDARANDYGSSRSLPKHAAAMMLPVYSQAFKAFDKRRSEERTAIAFLGILQYRNQHHAWPTTLKAAGVDAIDAIDGKPLRYLVSGKSARVYNLGQNGVDNGGLSRWEAAAKKTPTRDIDNAYVYPWPPRPKK
jgi:hypothetical protein